MSAVTRNHIEAATTILNQIAFSGGEGSDPQVTLARWRRTEGLDDMALEAAARESSNETIEEIEQAIEDGRSFSTEQLREYIEREYLVAFQVGWVTRARYDTRAKAKTDGD